MKFTLLVFVFGLVVYATGEDWVCRPNEPYIENQCNSCSCGENRKLFCTKKACLEPEYEKLRNCKVGISYPIGFNRCWCVKDLGTICTHYKP